MIHFLAKIFFTILLMAMFGGCASAPRQEFKSSEMGKIFQFGPDGKVIEGVWEFGFSSSQLAYIKSSLDATREEGILHGDEIERAYEIARVLNGELARNHHIYSVPFTGSDVKLIDRCALIVVLSIGREKKINPGGIDKQIEELQLTYVDIINSLRRQVARYRDDKVWLKLVEVDGTVTKEALIRTENGEPFGNGYIVRKY